MDRTDKSSFRSGCLSNSFLFIGETFDPDTDLVPLCQLAEEIDSCGNHQQTERRIKETCPLPSGIGDNELRISGRKEPVPVEQRGQ